MSTIDELIEKDSVSSIFKCFYYSFRVHLRIRVLYEPKSKMSIQKGTFIRIFKNPTHAYNNIVL